MIQVNLNDQELFDIIMALYAFEKTSAVSPADESEVVEFQELARRRHDLFDKLHDLFEQNTMLRYRKSPRVLQAADLEFSAQG
jgi:hypothetical protein